MEVSKQFRRVQKLIKATLPYLGISIIIGVYLITGFVMGHFLAIRMDATTAGLLIVAYGTGYAAQVVRGYIVFHNQLGYEFVAGGKGYIFYAWALAIYTSVEAYFLEPQFAISIIGLIASGFIVEIMYIDALNRSSMMELTGNKVAMNSVKDAYKSQSEMRKFLDSLQDDEEPAPPTLSPAKPESRVSLDLVLIERTMNKYGVNGDEKRGKAIDMYLDGKDLDDIIDYAKSAGNEAIEVNFSPNGKH